MLKKLLDYFKKKPMQVRFQKLSPFAKSPTKAYADDAGWDVYATESLYLLPGQQGEVKIGLAFETPPGWHLQLHTRSSFGKRMMKCHLGIVDSGYRNEISVWVHNYGYESQRVNVGDKVCQLIFAPVLHVDFIEAQQLTESERGLKGHGSSGR